MEIVQATTENAETIATRLSEHFTQVNKQFTYNKYKTDYQRILEQVQERLTDPNSDFKYFILLADNGELAGFVNTLNTPSIYEILYLDLMEQYNTVENAKKLARFAIDMLKNVGADKILTEATIVEPVYAQAIEDLGAKLIERKFILL